MTKVQIIGGAVIMANWFMVYQGGIEAIPSAVGFWVNFAMWMALTRGKA